jgi:hypothetical protein
MTDRPLQPLGTYHRQLVFRDGGHLVLTFEFWRERHLREHPGHAGTVVVAELPEEELTAILDQLAAVLGQDDGGT